MISGFSKVNLLGVTRNTHNFGVRVLLSGAVGMLTSQNSDVEVRILDYGRDPEAWEERSGKVKKRVQLINLRYSWRFYLPNNVFRILALVLLSRCIPSAALRTRLLSRNPWIRQVLEADVNMSLAGGDSFSDIYRLSRLLYVALPQVLVLWLGRPLVLLPQTYGPFKTKVARWIARYIVQRANTIYSRDEAGVRIVRDLLGRPDAPVQVVQDLGFAMEPDPLPRNVAEQVAVLRRKGLLVGLNISKLLYIGGYTGRNMFGLKEDYPKLMGELIDFIIRDLGISVLLVPHVGGGEESQESEYTLCRKLFASLKSQYGDKIVFIDESLDHKQTKGLIGQCDLFIGARMHACIAAASQDVPTIALAYSDKFAGVLELAGSSTSVVDLRHTDAKDLRPVVRAAVSSQPSAFKKAIA